MSNDGTTDTIRFGVVTTVMKRYLISFCWRYAGFGWGIGSGIAWFGFWKRENVVGVNELFRNQNVLFYNQNVLFLNQG